MPINVQGLGIVDKQGNKSMVVNLSNARQMTYAEYQQLTAEQKNGAIIVTDYPIPEQSDYVEVTCDGEKTIATLLNEMFPLIDFTKINEKSAINLQWSSSGIDTFLLSEKTNTNLIFNCSYVTSNTSLTSLNIKSSNSSAKSSLNGVVSDKSTDVLGRGYKIVLCYNSVKTLEVGTLAQNCMLSNGQSVESAINNMFHVESVTVENHAIVANDGGFSVNCPVVNGKTPVFARYKTTTGYNVVFVTTPLYRSSTDAWLVSLYSIYNQSVTTRGVVEIYYL